jgi:hypothetical protein
MTPDYSKLTNPNTFSTGPVYIFDLEMIPAPPGTPAAERPADRPRVLADSSQMPAESILYQFDDRTDSSQI